MENLPAVIQQAAQLQGIDTSRVNLLLPTQSYGQIVGAFDKVTLEVMVIDPNPQNGECYDISGKKALAKPALDRMYSALGMIEDPANTTILESSPRKSRAKATAAIRKPNGEYVVLTEEKTVDIDVIEEEQTIKVKEDTAKGKPSGWGRNRTYTPWTSEAEKADWIELTVQKAVLPYKKFKDERAMTGARERLVRAIVGLKSSYTDAELSKPFVFPRVTTDTDKLLSDERTRQLAVEKMTGSVRAIFGGAVEDAESEPRDVTPAREAIEAPKTFSEVVASQTHEEDEDPFSVEKDEPDDPAAELKVTLELYMNDTTYPLKASARETIQATISDPLISAEELQTLIERAKAYRLEKYGEGAA